MSDWTELSNLILAGTIVLAATGVGVALRMVFGRMARRSATTRSTWDDLGWRLLKDVALPAAVVTGTWWASAVAGFSQPVRGAVHSILLAVIVLTVTLAMARVAASVVGTVALARSGVAQSASIFVNITRGVVIAIGVLVLLQSLGVSVTPLLTALGVGGLAVALALQDTLSNLFAGLQLLASKKVQTGDFIKLDSGENGYVLDINWRNTTVRELSGNIVVVPNARLADAVMTNYHQPAQDMSVAVRLGVSYESDLEHVERVTIEVGREVMKSVQGAVPDHEPVVRFHTFGESSIDFTVFLRAGEYADQFLVVHEFVKRLHTRYRLEGIEIPFPIRTLVLPDGALDLPKELAETAAR